jgi:hypothetical protein
VDLGEGASEVEDLEEVDSVGERGVVTEASAATAVVAVRESRVATMAMGVEVEVADTRP